MAKKTIEDKAVKKTTAKSTTAEKTTTKAASAKKTTAKSTTAKKTTTKAASAIKTTAELINSKTNTESEITKNVDSEKSSILGTEKKSEFFYVLINHNIRKNSSKEAKQVQILLKKSDAEEITILDESLFKSFSNLS